MSDHASIAESFEGLPDELLAMILAYHFDVARNPVIKASQPQSMAPRLQFQCALQMSLCRVSKRFYECISKLLRANGLIRVTCLVDPHLDFYYLSPTICHSEHTDKFQVSCPSLWIDLSHGIDDALVVQSIVSKDLLPTALGLVRLHHAASLVLLPTVHELQQLDDGIKLFLSTQYNLEDCAMNSIDSLIMGQFPEMERHAKAGRGWAYSLAEQPHGSQHSPALWVGAIQIARTHCLSEDVSRRRLGLRILRYILITMMVVINPWEPNPESTGTFDQIVKMMALASAVLIDAIVVEPQILTLFYGKHPPETFNELHQEVCPCGYLPLAFERVLVSGNPRPDLTWSFIRSTMCFLHCILEYDQDLYRKRLDSFREMRMETDDAGLKSRTDVYISAIERTSFRCKCNECIGTVQKVFFPDI